MGTCECVLAYACDRVRALTMREYAACLRVRRALFVRPSIDGTRTGIVYRYMMHACIYIRARLATPMNGSPMRARRTHARTCCVRVCARVCACAIGRPRIRADTCERLSSAWTAGGSARRRSTMRPRSTRTSARGTPPLSSRWVRYAPPFRPRGAPPQAGRARRVVDAARAVVRGGDRRCTRAGVRRRVGTRVCPRA